MIDRIQSVISGVFESHEGRNVTPKQIQDYLDAMQLPEKPIQPIPTKPIKVERKPESQKKHIKQTGKK